MSTEFLDAIVSVLGKLMTEIQAKQMAHRVKTWHWRSTRQAREASLVPIISLKFVSIDFVYYLPFIDEH